MRSFTSWLIVILLAVGCQRASDELATAPTLEVGAPTVFALLGVPASRHCDTDGACSGANQVCSKVHGDPLGTGVCVDACGSITCRPGQVADRRNGCRCLGGSGPGSPCELSAGNCPTGTTCRDLAGVFGADRNPGGPVCVSNANQACSSAVSCPQGSTCVTTASSSSGYCTSVCGGAACRFDEEAVASGSGCTCRPRDPIGRTCGSDADCGWSAGSRTCATVGASRRCVAPGFCGTTDTCNDGQDQDCSGLDRKPVAEACGNGFDDDCNGVNDDPAVCAARSWCRDDDADGFCTECTTAVAAPSGGRWVEAGCAQQEPAACGGNAGRNPGAAETCDQVDSNCNGMADEPCPDCDRTDNATDGLRFTWSCYRRPSGHCVQILEAEDPDAWHDNYLCSSKDIGLEWSFAGRVEGKQCIQIYEHAEPESHAWHDNYLCWSAAKAPRLTMTWTQAGEPKPGCVQWLEPSDSHAWSDNYLCHRYQAAPACICPDGFRAGTTSLQVCNRVCLAHQRGRHVH